MRVLFVLMILVAAALPARAETHSTVKSESVICQVLSAYQTPPGVEAEGSVESPIHDVVRIPVTVDLEEAFGISVDPGVEMKPEVAAVEVHADGRIFYNEEDLTAKAEALCSKSRAIYTRTRQILDNDNGTAEIEREELKDE